MILLLKKIKGKILNILNFSQSNVQLMDREKDNLFQQLNASQENKEFGNAPIIKKLKYNNNIILILVKV